MRCVSAACDVHAVGSAPCGVQQSALVFFRNTGSKQAAVQNRPRLLNPACTPLADYRVLALQAAPAVSLVSNKQ
eukprot:1160624-Pelagomonas_calceolata.AAC.16